MSRQQSISLQPGSWHSANCPRNIENLGSLSVTHNPTKGNIIGCHLIRINVKASVRWTRPWNSTVRCKMWFLWKTHLRGGNGAETAPGGSAKSTWMFRWICFHWAQTKKKKMAGPTEKLGALPSNMNMPDSDCVKASSRLKTHTGAAGSAGAVCFLWGGWGGGGGGDKPDVRHSSLQPPRASLTAWESLKSWLVALFGDLWLDY